VTKIFSHVCTVNLLTRGEGLPCNARPSLDPFGV